MNKNSKKPSEDYLMGLHDGVVMLSQMIIKDIDGKQEKEIPNIILDRLNIVPKMAKEIKKDLRKLK